MRLIPMLLIAMAACTPNPADRPASQGPPPPGGASAAELAAGVDTTLTGRVRQVGSAPMSADLILEEPEGRSTVLVGRLTDELKRLTGTEVRLRGRHARRTLEVAGYEVLSANGQPVVMGTVERVAGAEADLRTEDGRIVRLTGGIGALRVGQKVWVQGPQTVTVQSYSIIKP